MCKHATPLIKINKSIPAILAIVIMLLCQSACFAQLCTGSLGDAIKTIDFGSGTATHGSALGTDFTSYTYSSADFPSDGSYTIENSTAGSGSVWWSTTDHTGNTGGYMMVVNASVSTTDYFYKSSITGLCPGTTYEFAAWIVNLLRSRDTSPPNITFSIEKPDGTILQSYTTGSIPLTTAGPVWKQFGFFFTTPTGVSDIVIRMRNNSAGGAPANDLALDDITFRACGPTMVASFNSTSAVTTLNACANTNQSYTLSADVSTGYTNPAYQWQVNTGSGWTDIAGATSTTYTVQFRPAVAGTYQYRIISAEAANIGSTNCQVASNILTLTVNVAPSSTATATTPVCAGASLTLNASTGASYSWTGPNGFTSTLQSPVISNVTTAAAGTYTVVVTSTTGCTVTVPVTVAVIAQPVANAGDDVTICAGDATTLNASGGLTYLWSPTTGLSDATIANPVASPTDSTTYTVTVSNGSGCTATDAVNVNVWQKPVANAGADKFITQGQSVTLSGSAKGTNVSYYWTPTDYLSSSTILQPVASPVDDITYTLHVVSNIGCGTEATDAVFVRVYKKVVVPNTFTPNGDGTNDTWAIEALDTYPESVTQVFNRYGAVVFKSIGYSKAWDGKYNGQDIPAGTYYYIIDLKNGKTLTGWVLVVR
jgi:gliding motility-associated-like protein